MTSTGSVTAVVPLYQGERFIHEAIESLIGEEMFAEVIVVDDGSKDQGPDIVRSRFPAVRLIQQANAGVSRARNVGMEVASTKFVVFLDQDDQLIQGSMSELIAVAQDTSADFVYGDYIQMDESGNLATLINQPDVTANPVRGLLERCCSASVCCLFRKDALSSIGGFDESMMGCEDWDLYLRLALNGARMNYVPGPVFRFRYHAASTSKRFWLMWRCFQKFEAKHRFATLAQPDGARLELRRRDQFLDDNLRFLYGPDDEHGRWLYRRFNRTQHFLKLLARDRRLAMELVRRSVAKFRR